VSTPPLLFVQWFLFCTQTRPSFRNCTIVTASNFSSTTYCFCHWLIIFVPLTNRDVCKVRACCSSHQLKYWSHFLVLYIRVYLVLFCLLQRVKQSERSSSMTKKRSMHSSVATWCFKWLDYQFVRLFVGFGKEKFLHFQDIFSLITWFMFLVSIHTDRTSSRASRKDSRASSVSNQWSYAYVVVNNFTLVGFSISFVF